MAKIIGVDLGTSNSAASVLEGGKPVIIPAAEGNTVGGKTTPSVVAFTKDGQRLVGLPALRQAISNPEGTIMAAKRKMGSDHKFSVYSKSYTPQEISAAILQKIKADAEAFIGEKVEKAVITVPAYFNDNQRQATKDAGLIAGLDVVRIINEPTAAALAYGLDKSGADQKILVFDLGGGTLDVTLMEFGSGVFEVRSTSGDTQLGGTDMDRVVMNYLIDKFKKETGVDLTLDPTAMQRLREACEKAKIELSTVLTTEINLPYITADKNGPKHLKENLSRAKLEELIEPIIKKCEKPIYQALNDAKLQASNIDKLILVGGPTRIPKVQQFLENIFGNKIVRGVNPMECVAMGAAIQGGVLAGEIKDLLLLDVTPLSLGIETLGGVMTKVIERNTTIPTKRSQVFSTAADMQTSVDIRVFQGERAMASDNVELGKFGLVGIAPAPRGVPQIEVTFDIDANGLLKVHAKDKGTGKEQQIVITAPHKMNKDEINSKVNEAENFAEKDKEKLEEVQTKNDAETLVYTAEKTLNELSSKIKASDKEKVETAMKNLKATLSENKPVNEIKNKSEELSRALQEIGAKMYEDNQNTTQSTNQTSNEEKKGTHPYGDDDVVEGKFKETK